LKFTLKGLLAFVCIGALLCPPVKASTALSSPAPHALHFTGFVEDGPSLDGIITLDPATGTVTGAEIKTFGSARIELNQVNNQHSNGVAYIMSFGPAGADCPRLIIGERATPASLQGYPGSAVGPLSVYAACDGTTSRVLGALSVIHSGGTTF